jgi:hypothetical protein
VHSGELQADERRAVCCTLLPLGGDEGDRSGEGMIQPQQVCDLVWTDSRRSGCGIVKLFWAWVESLSFPFTLMEGVTYEIMQSLFRGSVSSRKCDESVPPVALGELPDMGQIPPC